MSVSRPVSPASRSAKDQAHEGSEKPDRHRFEGAARSENQSSGCREAARQGFTLYAGVALSLAWFSCVWFVPQAYANVELLSYEVTIAWLAMLGISALTMFAVPALLGTARHLSDSKVGLIAAPSIMAVSGALFMLCLSSESGLFFALASAAIMGVSSAVLWLQWGEYYAAIRATYHISQVAPTVGIVILCSLAVTTLLPQPASALFASSLPLLSAALLLSVHKRAPRIDYPRLLPKKERREGAGSALMVGAISAAASAACYYTLAIIPLSDLPFGENFTFTVGAALAAVVLVGMGCAGRAVSVHASIFRMFPWLLVAVTCAALLYLSGNRELYGISFFIATTVYCIFEVMLLMYIGILATKGYVSPALAFGFSGGFVRLGALVGNGIAVLFEENPVFGEPLALPCAILFAALTVFLLIPLVRREYAITAIIAPVTNMSDLESQVACVADEFRLSAREREVLSYLVRGYTAEAIGKQLYISNFTVQTHIQHIYSKTQIHKRSELIDYVSKRDLAECEQAGSNSFDRLPEYWPLPS